MELLLVPILLVIIFIPFTYSFTELLTYLIYRERCFSLYTGLFMDFMTIVVTPCVYYSMIDPEDNICCAASTALSTEHRLVFWGLMGLCGMTYFYTRCKPRMVNSIVELICNIILLIGIILYLIILKQKPFLFIFWIAPFIILFALQIIENHKNALAYSSALSEQSSNHSDSLLWRILKLNLLLQIPILLLLCVPIIALMLAFLCA